MFHRSLNSMSASVTETNNFQETDNSFLDNSFLAYPVNSNCSQAAHNSQNKAVLSSLDRVAARLLSLEQQVQPTVYVTADQKRPSDDECQSVLQQNKVLDERLMLARARCDALEKRLKSAYAAVDYSYISEVAELPPELEMPFSAIRSRPGTLTLPSCHQRPEIPPPLTVNTQPLPMNTSNTNFKDAASIRPPTNNGETVPVKGPFYINNPKPVIPAFAVFPAYLGAGDSSLQVPTKAATAGSPTSLQSQSPCNEILTALPLRPPQQLDEYPVRLVGTDSHYLPHKIKRKKKVKAKTAVIKTPAKVQSGDGDMTKASLSVNVKPVNTVANAKTKIQSHRSLRKKDKNASSEQSEKLTLPASCSETFDLNRVSATICDGRDLEVVTRVLPGRESGVVPVEVTVSTIKRKETCEKQNASTKYWTQTAIRTSVPTRQSQDCRNCRHSLGKIVANHSNCLTKEDVFWT